jgi:hypothetical protein
MNDYCRTIDVKKSVQLSRGHGGGRVGWLTLSETERERREKNGIRKESERRITAHCHVDCIDVCCVITVTPLVDSFQLVDSDHPFITRY